MYAGFATAEESNKRYRYLIESGATGLSCAFDLPTQIGYDSDDAVAEGEVGKVGVRLTPWQIWKSCSTASTLVKYPHP